MSKDSQKLILNILDERMTSVLEGWEYEEQGKDYERLKGAYDEVASLVI